MHKNFTSSTEHVEYIQTKLLKLTKSKQVAFLASITERMLPLYNSFFEEECKGSPEVLKETLDKLWVYSLTNHFPTEEINTFKTKCMQVSPFNLDEEELTTELAMYASNTSLVLDSVLSFCIDANINLVDDICKLVFNTIDAYIQDHAEEEPAFSFQDPNMWDKLWNYHSLFIKEQQKQLTDLLKLKNQVLNPELIQQLKKIDEIQAIIPDPSDNYLYTFNFKN